MENKKVSEKKDSWLKVLLSYTEGSGQRLGISVILSVISIISGLMPYYCIYRGINLYIRNLNQAPMQEILRWCLYVLAALKDLDQVLGGYGGGLGKGYFIVSSEKERLLHASWCANWKKSMQYC